MCLHPDRPLSSPPTQGGSLPDLSALPPSQRPDCGGRTRQPPLVPLSFPCLGLAAAEGYLGITPVHNGFCEEALGLPGLECEVRVTGGVTTRLTSTAATGASLTESRSGRANRLPSSQVRSASFYVLAAVSPTSVQDSAVTEEELAPCLRLGKIFPLKGPQEPTTRARTRQGLKSRHSR